jgi:hypothetical protein
MNKEGEIIDEPTLFFKQIRTLIEKKLEEEDLTQADIDVLL